MLTDMHLVTPTVLLCCGYSPEDSTYEFAALINIDAEPECIALLTFLESPSGQLSPSLITRITGSNMFIISGRDRVIILEATEIALFVARNIDNFFDQNEQNIAAIAMRRPMQFPKRNPVAIVAADNGNVNKFEVL